MQGALLGGGGLGKEAGRGRLGGGIPQLPVSQQLRRQRLELVLELCQGRLPLHPQPFAALQLLPATTPPHSLSDAVLGVAAPITDDVVWSCRKEPQVKLLHLTGQARQSMRNK